MRRSLPFIQVAVSLVALGSVAYWVSRQQRPTFPSSATAFGYLVGALALYGLATVLRAERWRRILARSGIAVGRPDVYGLLVVGYMGNNVLPARSGELLRVFLLAPRAHTPKRRILGTVLAERLLDATALGSILAGLLLFVVTGPRAPDARPVAIFIVAAVVALAALAAALVLLRHRSIVARVGRFVSALAMASRDLLSVEGVLLLALSIVVWIVEAAVYFTVGRATGIRLGLTDALYVVALANLFSLIPAAPGYVGTFDAAVVFAVKGVGAASSAVVSYLLLLRFVLFVPITLVGFAVLVARYGGWARYRAARSSAGRLGQR